MRCLGDLRARGVRHELCIRTDPLPDVGDPARDAGKLLIDGFSKTREVPFEIVGCALSFDTGSMAEIDNPSVQVLDLEREILADAVDRPLDVG